MKKNLQAIFLFFTVLVFFSCQKASLEPAAAPTGQLNPVTQPIDAVRGGGGAGGGNGCTPTTVTLLAGQTINAGSVAVENDNDSIYVTYTTANGWYLTQTHLYVGPCSSIPVNGPGNPMPGQFPYSNTLNNATTYTYSVPISVFANLGCGCIAAHAVVVQLGSGGNVIAQQTGWGNGARINPNGGNWGMKFSYCLCTGQQ